MPKNKWYVIWKGLEPGVYDSWNECQKQIKGYDGALYKSFASEEEARKAFQSSPYIYIGKENKKGSQKASLSNQSIIQNSLSVDAACSGNPGVMEYRGVYTATGEEIFRKGPYPDATNNIGEFLALVHGLAFLKNKKSNLPIYSDSATAMAWIKKKKCNTKLEPTEQNKLVFEYIARAEKWLNTHSYSTPVYKWDTEHWGEIPADFGRK